MGASGSNFYRVDETGEPHSEYFEIRNANDVVVGRIGFHAQGQADGSIRAQLELRFADKPGAYLAPGPGIPAQGYALGRSGVLVEMEPRQSQFDPMRFSIDIPGETGDTGADVRSSETPLATINRAREALSTLRAGCQYPHCGDSC